VSGSPTVAVYGGRFGEFVVQAIQGALPDTRVVAAGSPRAEEAEVLVTLVDDAPGLAGALGPRIRWVHILGAGADGFPFEVLGDRLLTCSRGAGGPAIAEFVLATMLAFEKRLPGSWITEPVTPWNTAQLGGLEGRTLGIIGVGAIGSEVARRALAFSMEVIATRRRPGPPPVDGVALCPDLPTLLGRSDHLVVAAPATPATFHLLDEAAFAAVKPGVHVVNVARGSLVDQDALLRALDDGRVAMASLDVVDPEPLPDGHPFYRHPSVRLSPHISWSSPRTAVRTITLFTDNLARFREGRELLGAVDKEAGY
jgi:phosphoglycerate dehydrogenase-like enzyme